MEQIKALFVVLHIITVMAVITLGIMLGLKSEELKVSRVERLKRP